MKLRHEIVKKVNIQCVQGVEVVGRFGEMWMPARNSNFKYEILLMGSHFIHLSIRGDGIPLMFCTVVYIHPQANRKSQCFENIKSIAKDSNGPWVLVEDFNEILYEVEKKDGAPVEYSRCFHFRK